MRSEEISELLDRIPNKTNNWLFGVVFFIFIVMISISAIIDYPDIVKAEVRLIAQEQPFRIVSQSNGQVIFLFNSSNSSISNNTPIGYIANHADYKSVLHLKEIISNTLKANYSDSMLSYVYSTHMENLGELNPSYYSLINSASQYLRVKKDSLFTIEQEYIKQKIVDINRQLKIKDELLCNSRLDLDVFKTKESTDSMLMSQNIILPMAFNESKLGMLNAHRSLLKLLAEKENLLSSLKDIGFELNKKNFDRSRVIKEIMEKIIENTQKLSSEITQWENLYLFVSPIQGNLEISGFIENGQFVEKGKEIFKILPLKSKIKGQIFIPSLGAGEVKDGSILHVHLNDYPSYEYGYLKGKLVNLKKSSTIINGVPGYLGEIEFENGMITSFGIELSFMHEMHGEVDILTRDKKLISKIFNRVKYFSTN